MKRLLVIFHIYYHDQVDWFIEKMKNINDCEWSLICTCSSENLETVRRLKEFKPDVRFIMVDNIGYDVWPFIKIIKDGYHQNYDFVLKLHTKGALPGKDRINKVNVGGWRWRNMLVDAILKSQSRFKKCLNLISRDKTGMVCCYEMLKNTDLTLPEDTYLLDKEAERIGMDLNVRKFCAGTMFLVKSDVLNKFTGTEIDEKMWNGITRSQSTGSIAHVYERLLSMAAYDDGYSIKGVAASLLTGLKAYIYKIRRK